MKKTIGRRRGGSRATFVLSAALGAALVCPTLAAANIKFPSQPVVVPGQSGSEWPGPTSRNAVQRLIVTEAVGNGVVPASLALAVAEVESNFVPRTVGASGTVGVMQIHPTVAEKEFETDAVALRDPATNVRLGLQWLARLHTLYDGDWELALSHYRGGELAKNGGRYRAHEYTRDYVQRVMRCWQYYERDVLVEAWIREARGGSRFDDGGIRPRIETWIASDRSTYHRNAAYHWYARDHYGGAVVPDQRGCVVRTAPHWPSRRRFDDGEPWTATTGVPGARFRQGGGWIPITGAGGWRFH